MNKLDLCLEVVQGHANLCDVSIAPKLLELETKRYAALFFCGRTNNCERSDN